MTNTGNILAIVLAAAVSAVCQASLAEECHPRSAASPQLGRWSDTARVLLANGSADSPADELKVQDTSLNDHQPAPPTADPGWHGEKGALYRCAPGAEIKELQPDRLQLDRGEVIVEPSHCLVVTTPLAETQLSHKAVVLFRIQGGNERCMVLWDGGPESVVIVFHNRKLCLTAGQEALLTDYDPNYREIVESDDIGRRRIQIHDLKEHKHIVTAEFSLLHALQRDPLLYDLAHSKDKHDRTLRERILKTAAVLDLVTARHGRYTTTAGY